MTGFAGSVGVALGAAGVGVGDELGDAEFEASADGVAV